MCERLPGTRSGRPAVLPVNVIPGNTWWSAPDTLLTTCWRGRTLILERSQPDGCATADRGRSRKARCERMKDGAP